MYIYLFDMWEYYFFFLLDIEILLCMFDFGCGYGKFVNELV